MWQNITRGFRESFSRGLNFGRNKNVRVQNEPQKTKLYQYNTSPCLLQTSWKSNNCQEKCGSKEDGPHGKEHKSYGAYDAFDSWLGAVSCSSALALGWALSQPSHLKRWFSRCQKKGVEKEGFARYWTHFAVAQPSVPSLKSNQEAIQDKVQDGSKTAEQTLKENLSKIKERHDFLSGSIQNKQAVQLLKKKNRKKKDEKKAFKLLLEAAEKDYGPAAYNLGICYQSGIGTDQDIVQAQECYSLATKLGHPTATYNLAVFYGKGLGGLTADKAKGIELLKKAAALGEPNAAKALGLEPITDSSKEKCADFTERPPEIYEMKHSEEFYKLFLPSDYMSDTENNDEIREPIPEDDIDDGTFKFWTTRTSPWDFQVKPDTDFNTSPLVVRGCSANENIKLATSVENSELPVEPKTDSNTTTPQIDIRSNAHEIFKLAASFENSCCVNTDQPYLTLHLYKMAAELGHTEAKSKYKMLLAYDSVDLLTEYICRGSKPSIDYYSNARMPTIY